MYYSIIQVMKDARFWLVFFVICVALAGFLGLLFWTASSVINAVQQTTSDSLAPIGEMAGSLGTQVSQVLNPTPTILPDPLSIIHEVRSLARLETVQYSIEKVITAESGQGAFGGLFGDRLLFVAHGTIIAGVDLAKLSPEDVWVKERVLFVRMPTPEIFVATLDNEKSYVYDRDTGLLTKGNTNLETQARQVAEEEIEKAAFEDGILDTAGINAENYLSRLLRELGFPEVIFIKEPSEE